MLTFITRRLLALVPILLGILLVTFVFLQLIPGSPVDRLLGERGGTSEEVARLRHQLGLDLSWAHQFLRYLRNLASGDFGQLYGTNQDVGQELFRRLPNTLRLALAAMAIATLVGVGSGIASATGRNTWIDYGCRAVALFGMSTPVFWFGLLLILLFSYRLGLLPPAGDGGGRLDHLLLPALALGLRPAAFIQRITRSSLLEVLGRDYILTARAKGLRRHVVLVRHALRNALLPVITVLGTDLGSLLSGAVITETMFDYPGVGRYLLFGIRNRQYAVVLATVLLTATIFVLANLTVDLLYAWLDPRIRDQIAPEAG